MSALLTALLALLSQLAPAIGTSEIGNIIATLVRLLPALVQVGEDLVQPVKNIIAALSNNSAATADQLADLKTLDAQVDQAFEAAATDAEAEDGKDGQ